MMIFVANSRFCQFILELVSKSRENQLLFLSNWLTFRVLLAFFPFLFFLLSLLGFLNLDTSLLMETLYEILPYEVYLIVDNFFGETINIRSHAMLSTGIIIVVISSLNGFRAVTRCINNTYEAQDRRNIYMQAVLSIVLMLIFTVAIVVMLVLLIFGNYLWGFLEPLIIWGSNIVYTAISWVVSLVVVTIVIMLIYKLSCAKRLKMRNVLPGAIFTVVSWTVSSGLFGMFIANFSNMSAIYGSIAGIFILMLWLNLISIILLIGNEMNALLYKRRAKR